MLHTRRIPTRTLVRFGLLFASLNGLWALLVYSLYAFAGFEFLRIPFQPIATIGTAVAFYVGFKNNSAYDRFWEGRKIWGGIVNSSRTWATFVLAYVHPGDDSEAAHAVRRELIYRQLAWINALRLQLRKTSRFFDRPARATRARLEAHAEHMRNDWQGELAPFLDPEELQAVSAFANPASQLVTTQGQRLAQLKADGQLDLFHQIELMHVAEELYTLQGKAERIKATPFPRQYAEYGRAFTRVFVFLVPFGMLDVFGDHVEHATLMATLEPVIPMIVCSGLVGWVFTTMDAIGDASEDPFERSMNDVPMNALCRVIEIDLRQKLGESDVPAPEAPIDHILY